MQGLTKGISPTALLVALFCFLFPFVTFSCQGQALARLSGLELVTGTTMQGPQMFGQSRGQKVPPEPLAILAAVCALAGIGLAFIKGKAGALAPGALSLLSVIFLLLLRSKISADAVKQGEGVIQVSYNSGFYLAVLFLLAAAGASAYELLGSAAGRSLTLKRGSVRKFCAQCGAASASGDSFCRECGASLEQGA